MLFQLSTSSTVAPTATYLRSKVDYLDDAEAILDLRALRCNNDFDNCSPAGRNYRRQHRPRR